MPACFTVPRVHHMVICSTIRPVLLCRERGNPFLSVAPLVRAPEVAGQYPCTRFSMCEATAQGLRTCNHRGHHFAPKYYVSNEAIWMTVQPSGQPNRKPGFHTEGVQYQIFVNSDSPAFELASVLHNVPYGGTAKRGVWRQPVGDGGGNANGQTDKQRRHEAITQQWIQELKPKQAAGRKLAFTDGSAKVVRGGAPAGYGGWYGHNSPRKFASFIAINERQSTNRVGEQS